MPLTRPRAYQIYDIDYKQSVRVITISNVTLSGGAPNAVDGVNLSLNDRILVAGQTNPVQNGIYYVTSLGTGSNGTWARSVDTDTTGELDSGALVMVTEGLIYADTQWKLTTNDPIIIGTTALTFVQNYLANAIVYGQTSFSIGSSNANATVSVAGTSNVAVFSTTGEYVTGVISATGNVSGSNITTSGNIIGVGGSFTGNVNFGNIFVGTYYWANGVVFSGGGGGSPPGGANTQIQFNDNGVFGGSAGLTFNKTTNAIAATGTVSVTGNITSGANLNIGGDIVSTGPTRIITGVSGAISLAPNASNVVVVSTTGVAVTGTMSASGTASVTGNITTGANLNISADIVSTGPTRIITGASGAISLAPNSSNVVVVSTTGVAVTGTLSASGTASITGNITTGANLNISGDIVDTGPMRLVTGAAGAISLAPNASNVVVVGTTGATVTGTMSASGTVTGAGLISTSTITTAGNITTSAANGVANIGAVGAFFNTVHARATSAQYADVAEYYASDRYYEPGTVVVFGGDAEVTEATEVADNRVAGVVSTNPAYIMNAGIQSQYSVAVALTGRVPTRVLGPVNKGSMMISAGNGYARACSTPAVGTVIGKSLENFSGAAGVIEIVIGRV